jgi:dihydropyrimidinase
LASQTRVAVHADELFGVPMTILIRGGTVVNHDHSWRMDVLVDEGTIVAVGPSLDAPTGTDVIDAGGCYVMPGGIDPHTHLELGFMGSVSADDFEWGTKAALAGGTTMVVDFCIPDPGHRCWRHIRTGAANPKRPLATTASTWR